MENRRFCFNGTIQGQYKEFVFDAPIGNGYDTPFGSGYVCTNKYCPKELLSGSGFLTPIRGETINEFIADCKQQIFAMSVLGDDESLLDIHILGLKSAIMDHLCKYNRLIFGDLLLYIDCFSYLLEADGFEESEIRKLYPKITREIVESYPNHIFNSQDLSRFKGSHFDFVLYNLEVEARK